MPRFFFSVPALMAAWTVATLVAVLPLSTTIPWPHFVLLVATGALIVHLFFLSKTYALALVRGPVLLAGLGAHLIALLVPTIPDTAGLILTFVALTVLEWCPRSRLLALQARIWGTPHQAPTLLQEWMGTQQPLLQALLRAHGIADKPQYLTMTIAPYGPFSGPIITAIKTYDEPEERWGTSLLPDNTAQSHLFHTLTQLLRAYIGRQAHTEITTRIHIPPPQTAHEALAQQAIAPQEHQFFFARTSNLMPGFSVVSGGLMMVLGCTFMVLVLLDLRDKRTATPPALAADWTMPAPETAHALPQTAVRRLHERADTGWAYPIAPHGTHLVCLRTLDGAIYSYLAQYTATAPHLVAATTPQAEALFAQNPCRTVPRHRAHSLTNHAGFPSPL